MLYLYAVTGDGVTPAAEAVDGSRRFGTTTSDGLHAVFTPVDAIAFSQQTIDQRAGDLEWLGSIGYRHQAVMAELMRSTAVVPLRAFSLFSSEAAVRAWMHQHAALLGRTLERLAGKHEWTLRLELDPERWSEAIVGRVPSLRGLQDELSSAAPGKAFLLRKKLDEEKKKASHVAEEELLAEIDGVVSGRIRCETVAESRLRRSGAFPQIDVLIDRDEESELHALRDDLAARYDAEGVTLALTGPWPPYTFAGGVGTDE